MPKTLSNAEIFIERYKELEQAVRSEYNISDYDSISFYLGHKTKYKKVSGGYCLLPENTQLLRPQRQGAGRREP